MFLLGAGDREEAKEDFNDRGLGCAGDREEAKEDFNDRGLGCAGDSVSF